MQGGHILCEKQTKNTQQPSPFSVAYPGAATTLIDTFVEHIATECTERENPSLSYLETTHRAISKLTVKTKNFSDLCKKKRFLIFSTFLQKRGT